MAADAEYRRCIVDPPYRAEKIRARCKFPDESCQPGLHLLLNLQLGLHHSSDHVCQCIFSQTVGNPFDSIHYILYKNETRLCLKS